MHLPTEISTWTDESVRSEYLPAISAWLKEYFKCEKVFIYNYNVRRVSHHLKCIASLTPASFEPTTRQDRGMAHGEVPYSESTAPKSPDNTPESCAKRLEFQFPPEAAAIKSGRYRYIEIDIVYPHLSEEGFEVTHNPAHRWYYKTGMSKDDIVLFKIDDNLEGVARCESSLVDFVLWAERGD
ncbi:hypothetical protein CLCR_05125 [Cladophialophora carrionii]|uniref:Uncharacterized protein n=1 Tax=Cladophialophora carrionii TaxID=86049 RepID=A0A1C1CKM1_9EURO|nr:hypothetical protein CLCR_05125 [Cladophialophora carrionii]